jgi:hypothetical protein
MDTAHMAIALGHNHWSQRHQANAVIYPTTVKDMEYSALMKDPRLQPLWTRGFGNKCGRLFQSIRKALFSPTKAAMLQSVKDGHLINWPGFTEDAINKHLKLTPATAMGHMNQRRQNI